VTIIAIKDGVMAVDSLISSGTTRVGHTRKWREVPKDLGGGYVAAAGFCGLATRIVEQVAEKGPAASIENDDGVNALWLRADGSVWCLDKEAFYQISGPFFAEGSGRAFAIGAMAAGASAAEAARIACEHDTNCGGAITILGVA